MYLITELKNEFESYTVSPLSSGRKCIKFYAFKFTPQKFSYLEVTHLEVIVSK